MIEQSFHSGFTIILISCEDGRDFLSNMKCIKYDGNIFPSKKINVIKRNHKLEKTYRIMKAKVTDPDRATLSLFSTK